MIITDNNLESLGFKKVIDSDGFESFISNSSLYKVEVSGTLIELYSKEHKQWFTVPNCENLSDFKILIKMFL